jgi:hypothetical protein
MTVAGTGDGMTPTPAPGVLLLGAGQRVTAPPEPVAARPIAPRSGKARRRGTGLFGRLVLLLVIFGLAATIYEHVGKPIQLPVWAVTDIEARLNASMEGALPDGALSVGGIEVTVGNDWVPHLVLEDLRVLQPGGQTLLTLPETQLTLDPTALLQGSLRAKSLRIVGARIVIRRDENGHFDLALGAGQGPKIDSLAALFDAADRAFALPALARLTTVDAEALSLSLSDARAGKTWEVGDGRLSIENREHELAAELGMSLVAGGTAPARAVFTVVATKGAGSARITAQVDHVAAKDLAAQTPILGFLGVLDAPISGRIAVSVDTSGIQGLEARLDAGAGALRPSDQTTPIAFDQAGLGFGYDPAAGRILLNELSVQSTSLRLKATGRAYMVDDLGQIITGALAGRRPSAFLGQIGLTEMAVDPAGLFEAPVSFSQGAIDLRLRLDPFEVDIGQLSLVEGDQRVQLSGQVAAAAGGWRSALDVSLNEVTLDRLLALWPVRMVPNTRAWVADNIRNARLANVHAALRIEPGAEPKVELGYSFANADLRVMQKMPPITGADGYATISGPVYTLVMSKGVITPPEGGSVDVSGTVFAVPDIYAKPSRGDVQLHASAPLTAMLSLLDQPPFLYLQKAGQPVELGSGLATVDGRISLPLVNKIGPGDVEYAVTGTVRDFVSEVVVKGRTVTAPVLAVVANRQGMTISGPGMIGRVPFDVTFSQEFGVVTPPARIAGTVTLSQRAVEEFGLGLPKSMVSGEGPGSVEIVLPKGQPGKLTLVSDLNGITLAIPELGWRKASGATGHLEADVTLGAVPAVTRLVVTGAGLTATGNVRLKANGGLDVARFEKVALGGWLNGAVEITGRGAGRAVGLAVTSGSIDIRKFPEKRGSSGSAEGSPIKVALDTLRVTDGIRLTGFAGSFSLSGGFNGAFSARINGATPVTGAVVPSKNGTAVRIQAEDAGAAMQSAGMFSSAHGGALDLTLVPRPEQGQYDGSAAISNIRVKYGSVMADLLSAISVIGLLDQLNGDGIVFNTAEATFLMTPNAIDVRKGSAVGASMGVSLAGIYHSDTGALDMTGVVSPIYMLNGIGSILTRKGEGLFGFAYRLRGTAGDPDVQVNPLSILTPGMFRDLFRAPPPSLNGGGG